MTLIKANQWWVQTVALLLVFSYVHGDGDDGTCIWYGNCGKNPNSPTGQCLNCYSPGKSPSRLPGDSRGKDAKKTLFEACPHFKDQYGSDPKVCCTPRQIEDMNDGFAIAKQLLDKCPTCFLNFRKNFCASTCSPVQSKFLEVASKNIRYGPKEPCGKWNTVDPGIFYIDM